MGNEEENFFCFTKLSFASTLFKSFYFSNKTLFKKMFFSYLKKKSSNFKKFVEYLKFIRS